MKLSFSTSASLFLVILINDFIQFSETQGQPGKPHVNVNPAAGDGTVYITCKFSQETNKNISCYLYTGDTPEPFKSTWTTKGNACNFNVRNTDLHKHFESASSRELSCDYTVNTDPPTRSPRSDKCLVGDVKLNLPTTTRNPTKTSNQPKTTRNSKGFTHRTTTTPTTMKPESAASKQPGTSQKNKRLSVPTTSTSTTEEQEPKASKKRGTSQKKKKLSVPTTSASTTNGTETKASKQPGTSQTNNGLSVSTPSTSAFNRPETKASTLHIWAAVLSLAAVILLGVTAVCLYRRRKKCRSAGIQQEPANNTEYSLLGLAGNLNADNTAGKEHIYSTVADHPSSGKPPTYDLVGSGGNTAKSQEDHHYASIGDVSSTAVMEQNPVYSLVQNH